jgi:hypothetical protein
VVQDWLLQRAECQERERREKERVVVVECQKDSLLFVDGWHYSVVD